jgi:spermidine synthase
LVDGFDNAGQPPQLCSQQFYNHCYRSLTSTGLFVVNLAGDEHPVPRIRRSFPDRLVVAGGDHGRSNVIVFASKAIGTQLCDVFTACSAEREPAVPAAGG